jgi:hypothetical protein
MSATIETIDAKGYLIGWVKALTGMYAADVRAIPEDKWTANFGGCTRPCNELTADAISTLVWCTLAFTGKAPEGDGREFTKQLAAECATKDAAIAKLGEAIDNFASGLAAASEELLNTVVTPPWGMPAPLFMIAQIAVSHIWYHDGQLNYVHCLLGDDKVHWMDTK